MTVQLRFGWRLMSRDITECVKETIWRGAVLNSIVNFGLVASAPSGSHMRRCIRRNIIVNEHKWSGTLQFCMAH